MVNVFLAVGQSPSSFTTVRVTLLGRARVRVFLTRHSAMVQSRSLMLPQYTLRSPGRSIFTPQAGDVMPSNPGLWFSQPVYTGLDDTVLKTPVPDAALALGTPNTAAVS